MELHLLNRDFKKELVITPFISATWSERFSRCGELVLELDPAEPIAELIGEGSWIGEKSSKRVMEVETLSQDTSGKLKVSARGIEAWFDRRFPKLDYILGGSTIEVWSSMNPGAIVISEMDYVMNDGSVYYLPISQIVNNSLQSNISAEKWRPGSLYDAMVSFCETYGLGFSLIPNSDHSTTLNTGCTTFRVYDGVNRTSTQTGYPVVVFSAKEDELSGLSWIQSNATLKTSAYVYSSKHGGISVQDPSLPALIYGLDNRVMWVDADDLPETITPVSANAKMVDRGRRALAANRRVNAIDGEVTPSATARYGVDYFLGDFVELRYGATKNAVQVTEYIRTQDATGVKEYPTLEAL